MGITEKRNWMFGLIALLLIGTLVACPSPTPPSPPPPGSGFTLQPSETTLNVIAGGEVTSFVDLKRDAGFNDLVQMTFDNLPAGFRQEWTRDSVNGDCSIQLSVDGSVAGGTYTLNLVGKTGAGATLRAQAAPVQVTVNVIGGSNANSFTLTTQPSILEITQTVSTAFQINAKRFASFNSPIQLSVEGAPSGLTVNFAQNPLPTCPLCAFPNTVGIQAQVLASANVAPNSYTLKIRGTGGGKSVVANLKVTVLPTNSAKFTLAINPTDLLAAQGGNSLTFAVQVNKLLGFTGDVAISFQNLPVGVSVKNLNTTTIRQFEVANTVAVGEYPIIAKGVGGGQTVTVPMKLEVISGADTVDPASVGTIALDNTFGSNGLVFFGGPDTLIDALRQPDGKFLLAGLGQFSNGGKLVRLNADGTFDSSFGVNGAAQGLDFNIRAIGFGANGKILVSGELQVDDQSGGGNLPNLARLARLNANGTLDTSFGQGGFATFGNIGSNFSVFAAFPAANDKTLAMIKIGGATELVRLTPGGNFDPDFDTDGRKPVAVGQADEVAVLDNTGTKIISAGFKAGTGAQYELARFDLNGVLDNSFDGDGKTALPVVFGGNALTRISLDASNRVLLAVTDFLPSTTRRAFIVARFGTNGALDNTFDGDGKRLEDLGAASDAAHAIAVNGKVVAVGSVAPTNVNNYATLRFNDNGSPDNSFGASGRSIFGFLAPPSPLFPNTPNPRQEVLSIAIPLPDGKVVAFGRRSGTQNVVMVRFNP